MWYIIVGLVALVIILVFKRASRFTSGAEIPKQIWTYWDSDELPELVQKSVDSWKRHSPDWTVTVVTPRTLPQFLPKLDISNFRPNDFVQRKVDLIRLHLVSEYGGVWSDATVVVKESHNWITNAQSTGGYDFIGYYRESFTTNKDYPVIENWLFAAPPRSPVVTKWRDEYAKTGGYEKIEDYVKDVKNSGVDVQKIGDPGYLTPYVSLQSVLQKEMTPDQIKNKIKVIKSDDGPFKHSEAGGWDPSKSMRWLCDQPSTEVPSVVKIYGNERKAVEGAADLKCVYKIFD
jgi:hypothetical protein